MEQKKKEEKHLNDCMEIIKKNIEKFEKESDQLGKEIKVMYDNYRSDSPELHNELVIEISRKAQLDEALKKNQRAYDRPYFGRVDYRDKEEQTDYSLYIGKNGVVSEGTNLIVIDWRAPISSIYYECQIGDGKYYVPEQGSRSVALNLKRTYEIEHGKLIDYYDSEVITNDELLMKYLVKNKEAVLGEIIATIQKEQNMIIRESPFRNVVVQGVAGSGKTTVAMHRISYILYNYPDKFQPNEFYIIGSNQMLLNYITGVLPDLDVHHVNQMVLEEFFLSLLDEDFDSKKYSVRGLSEDSKKGGIFENIRGSYLWFLTLMDFIREYEEKLIPTDTVYYQGKELYTKEAITEFLDNNKWFSTQAKIQMLNKRIVNKVRMENERRYEEKEVIRAEVKKYQAYFGTKKWKKNLFSIYIEFLEFTSLLHPKWRDELEEQRKEVEQRRFDIYDLAALVLMKRRFQMLDEIDEVRHMVVDEAQDFGVFVFAVMKEVLPKATFTIMGDVSQNIHFDSGMNDWEDLNTRVFDPERDKFYLLAKSYRNTVEISKFAEQILKHMSFTTYEIEPIIRHGKKPELLFCEENERQPKEQKEMVVQAAQVIRSWQESGYETIAVICRHEKEAGEIKTLLSEYLELVDTLIEKVVFTQGVMVLPVYLTKGLEFDTVLLWNPTKEQYPVDNGNAKLLYVAATRALHELCILYKGELSGLLKS